jgi:protein phosphatase
VTSAPVRVSVFGKTDLGLTRDHNEDTFLVADLSTGNASLQPDVRDHEVGPRGSLFMVADGMGGAAAGEVASAMAADIIYQHLATAWATDQDTTAARFVYRMKEAVELANQRIYAYAREHPDVRGMGTTVTAAGVFRDTLFLTQIGDSRGYLVRNGEAFQLTRDQSLTQRLVDAGELTEEEAEQSERRNIILQALGPDPRVKVDVSRQQLRHGDVLILCSDGLSGVVRREEFAHMASASPDLPTLCSALIDLANERGGPDNVTVVAARFHGEGLPKADSGDGAGYQVYHVPEQESSESSEPPEAPPPPPVPPAPQAPMQTSAEAIAPSLPGSRRNGLMIAVALVVLVALILAAIL